MIQFDKPKTMLETKKYIEDKHGKEIVANATLSKLWADDKTEFHVSPEYMPFVILHVSGYDFDFNHINLYIVSD